VEGKIQRKDIGGRKDTEEGKIPEKERFRGRKGIDCRPENGRKERYRGRKDRDCRAEYSKRQY